MCRRMEIVGISYFSSIFFFILFCIFISSKNIKNVIAEVYVCEMGILRDDT